MKTREIIFKLLELETNGFDEKKLAIFVKDETARKKLLKKAKVVIDICDKMVSE